MIAPPPIPPLFPYPPLSRSWEPPPAWTVRATRRPGSPPLQIVHGQSGSHGGAHAPHAEGRARPLARGARSEEHTSELQSHSNLVCRLLLEKNTNTSHPSCAQ